jgi:hypothetical protein
MPSGRSTNLTGGDWQAPVWGLPSEEKITCAFVGNRESSSNMMTSLIPALLLRRQDCVKASLTLNRRTPTAFNRAIK